MNMPRPRRAGRRCRAHRWAGAAADHGSDAAHQRFFDLLRTDEVNMRIDAAGGHDHAFAGDDFGRTTDGHGHARLDVGIASFANHSDFAALETDVGLDDTPVVDDHGVGDHGIHDIFVIALRLAHAIADHLAAAELDFLAIGREILLDLDEQFGIRQPQTVTDGRTEHFGISLTRYPAHGLLSCRSSTPITMALKP